MGQGSAFYCRDPDGHIVGLYYETDQGPPELKPALKNQAQRFGRGASMSAGGLKTVASFHTRGTPPV